MSIYHTSDDLQKAKFLTRAKFLADKGKSVDLTELRSAAKRTIPQNNIWWAWCSQMAEIVGDFPENVARDVKLEILGRKKVANVFTGEETYEDYHTHEMSDEEMSAFLTKVKQWAFSTYGWWLPSREDPGFEEMMREYGKRR